MGSRCSEINARECMSVYYNLSYKKILVYEWIQTEFGVEFILDVCRRDITAERQRNWAWRAECYHNVFENSMYNLKKRHGGASKVAVADSNDNVRRLQPGISLKWFHKFWHGSNYEWRKERRGLLRTVVTYLDKKKSFKIYWFCCFFESQTGGQTA